MASIILAPVNIAIGIIVTITKYMEKLILFFIKAFLTGLERIFFAEFRYLVEILKRITKEFKR